MEKPRTCVITVNFNGASDTAACIRSLQASEVPLFIVVVDNTPNDPDLESAVSNFPDITILRAPENLGFGRGNNVGIRWALKHMPCEFIFVLNNDAVIQPDTIRELEIAMSKQPGVGIAAPRIAYLDYPETLWYGGGEIDWRRGSARTPGFNDDVEAPLAMTERDVTFATGCALFVRRTVFDIVGGFDPRFFMYEEDVELCLRVVGAGFRIRYIPNALIFHRSHGSMRKNGLPHKDIWSLSNPNLGFYAFHVIRNRLLCMYVHARGKYALLALLFFPMYLMRRAIPFVLGGRFDGIHGMVRGILSFWWARYDRFVNELSSDVRLLPLDTVEHEIKEPVQLLD